MCKATIESNGTIDETEYGYNINVGIIFLMIIPYIILFFAFRKKIKKVINEVRSAKR
jgi:ABC-type glycerol-3-phosphate transport system permease component